MSAGPAKAEPASYSRPARSPQHDGQRHSILMTPGSSRPGPRPSDKDFPAMPTATAHAEFQSGRPHGSLAALALAALGVVYGDIGTSPLYTMKTVLDWEGGRI